MSAALPPVWFQREVPPGLMAEVGTRVTMLGPARVDDPFAGVGTAKGALASTGRFDAVFMDHAPDLRVIARTGIGYDQVDVAEATRRGIAVCNTPDGPTISTAEHAATLMLMVTKSVQRAQSELRNGGTGLYARHTAFELQGKVLGLVGFGRIARHLARIAGGIRMQVVSFDPFLPDAAFGPPVARAASLDELLAVADVVSVHVPLNEDNRGMFGPREFALMKQGAVFINTARGGLVDGNALVAALESGRLFGAGLDVTDPEPLPAGHPLLMRDDVVVTPHIASATSEGRVRIFRSAFEQVLQVLEGQLPDHLVNPEVWESLASSGSRE
jgi:phosphoglycerate dehydrogenase-like enzyme